MKKIGLVCLLIFGATRLMAQDASPKDSLSIAAKTFKFPGQNFKLPDGIKLNPNTNLPGGMNFFKYPGMDSLKAIDGRSLIKNRVTISTVDHMPIAALPSNSRMPVYRLQSNDKMPGSNLPGAPVVRVLPSR